MSSLDLMRTIWPRDDLDAKEKATLLALLQHVDERLRCWPSIARLATYTSLKRRALQYALASLEHRGFIQVHRGAGQGGASVYVVQPASWPKAETQTDQEQEAVPDDPPSADQGAGGGAPHARGVHHMHGGGAPHAPKLPMEPPIDSEAIASPPTVASDQSVSIWTQGLGFLIANGVAEKRARPILGRWRRDYGETVVLAIMAEAERHEVTEPVAWITAALKRRTQNVIPFQGGHGDGADRNLFGAQRPGQPTPGRAAGILAAAGRAGYFDEKS